jgi:hypothetical protein
LNKELSKETVMNKASHYLIRSLLNEAANILDLDVFEQEAPRQQPLFPSSAKALAMAAHATALDLTKDETQEWDTIAPRGALTLGALFA